MPTEKNESYINTNPTCNMRYGITSNCWHKVCLLQKVNSVIRNSGMSICLPLQVKGMCMWYRVWPAKLNTAMRVLSLPLSQIHKCWVDSHNNKHFLSFLCACCMMTGAVKCMICRCLGATINIQRPQRPSKKFGMSVVRSGPVNNVVAHFNMAETYL